MNNNEIKDKLQKICEEFEAEDIDVLIILRVKNSSRIAGTMCPVCALEELNDFVTTEEIQHNRNEVKIKVH